MLKKFKSGRNANFLVDIYSKLNDGQSLDKSEAHEMLNNLDNLLKHLDEGKKKGLTPNQVLEQLGILPKK